MPELLSRIDQVNWLTPAIADILDHGAPPPGGDGSIRQHMLTIQRELSDLETPAKIVNVRSNPSYTLYVAKPDTVGRLGNRRSVSPDEIKRSLQRIAEQHPDWQLGFMPELQDEEGAVGILLRTEAHARQNLRRLLVRNPFKRYPSTTASVLGLTLEQQIVLYDIVQDGPLIIAGHEAPKTDLIRGMLLTLILFNTPGELRLAFVGRSSEAYINLANTPHTLGRILSSVLEGQRLIEGLVKEVRRRQKLFEEKRVKNLASYNATQRDNEAEELPRVLLLLDSLTDEEWQEAREQWVGPVVSLLLNGAQVGIHVLMAAERMDDDLIPSRLSELVPAKIIMPTSAKQADQQMGNSAASLGAFIDAFFVRDNQKRRATGIELYAVTSQEIERAITYWKQQQGKRQAEHQEEQISGATGTTEVFNQVGPGQMLPSPPTPKPPTPASLNRATQALQGTPTPATSPKKEPENVSEAQPTANTSELDPQVLQQAQALATYLGWLGVGPLIDVLCVNAEEAQTLLDELKTRDVLEDADVPTPRLKRPIQG